MRYFAELAYKGTNYKGWQRQPNAISVQQTIESAFSTILRMPLSIMGCGRTDAGVHASQFFIHFDLPSEIVDAQKDFPKALLKRMNKYLPPDIAIRRIFEVAANAHVRFDATHRAYEYHLIFDKNPFLTEGAFCYPFGHRLDFEKMQEVAHLLLEYDSFFPFCKTKSDAKTMLCDLSRSEWVWKKEGEYLVFHISANRFLRGMVRLIVGMCLNVGIGKVTLEELKLAMDNQEWLKISYSVPPNGLFLVEVGYGSMSLT
ncbi:MAG TPA: tRNA pseudouridine(38-40) synthase TruA [Phaeodactylibacter sp.]|nr:tRNA pseudouridine(38-40) synthase TruA [Phaeodactylibacter sp.]